MSLPGRSSKTTRFGTACTGIALLFSCALLAGCADGVFSADDAYETRRPADGAKFRQAHLLQRALRTNPGKSASSNDLGLIIAVQSGVDKQKVVDRYRITSRYKVANRFEYGYVFDGFAWTVDDTTGSNDFQEFLDSLMLDPDILWFEPDFDVNSPPSSAASSGSGQQIPWSVAAVGGQTSWAVSGDGQGSVDVDVYILDTGVAQADSGDPNDDLALVESIDFREGFNDAADYDGHGTHVAGIVAAVDDNDGLVGLAPNARVHNFKVLGDDGRGDVSQVIAAIEHITAEKTVHPSSPLVVNLSLGEDIGSDAHSALDDAVSASVAAGVVYVVAAGNHGKDAANVTPAKVSEAITVGAFDGEGRFSSFSNYGPIVDLLAPGEGIVSLSPAGSGSAVEMSGTSMAAAHVTGAAALYLAQHPSATPQQVRDALVATAQDFVTDPRPSTTTRSVWVGQAPPDATVVEARVASGTDDAEENDDGDMYLDSSDLEMAFEGSNAQTIGIRFTGLAIPQSATITNAYVQFTVDETDSGTANLTIRGQDTDDAAGFSSSANNLSSRPTTAASASWAPPAWNTVGEAGPDQRTPDLSSVLQEIINRGGWSSGNDLVLLITGTGERTAESYNGSSSQAPLLHVEWTTGPGGPPPPPVSQTLETRVASAYDDAEESILTGDIDRGSSDLELSFEGSNAQIIGMRFTGLAIPQGATITNAYVQFTVDETDSGPTVLTIRGEASNDAASFSSSDFNISSRPQTVAAAAWSPAAWNTVGEAGPNQRTPDLSAIIQEIVNRPGWSADNLVILITGTGERTAESYNGEASKAPLLHVEYQP